MVAKPNILLIVVDQQRYDCLGYSKCYPVSTPNIDTLAGEGMWFENAFTPIPLCCPARQSLLNGRRPEAFGALWNYDITLKIPALAPTEYTWTRELKDHGYRMAYIGKWHVSPDHDPTEYGFNYYFGEKHYEDYRREKYPEVTYPNGWIGETDPIPLENSRTHYLAALAIDKIKDYTLEKAPCISGWISPNRTYPAGLPEGLRKCTSRKMLSCGEASQMTSSINPIFKSSSF